MWDCVYLGEYGRAVGVVVCQNRVYAKMGIVTFGQ